ncbi:hypothetical protein EJB05_02096 [Eragrostis curvula]|uniref:Uncharacterized protein n=1 Tax=Eragrostis curvula TaxID=38414 RepID=A0A5J9WR89_9POAL|nr:hypothetical protein EJB05_02096 [Eragrostis curvula]
MIVSHFPHIPAHQQRERERPSGHGRLSLPTKLAILQLIAGSPKQRILYREKKRLRASDRTALHACFIPSFPALAFPIISVAYLLNPPDSAFQGFRFLRPSAAGQDCASRLNSERINMAFDATNLVLHIKTKAYSSIRLGYQFACEYPAVLGAGILLLFLHKLCPSLFNLLLSSSPVFLLTALLLGALLSYGEPNAPVIGEVTLEKQQICSNTSKISAIYSSTEVENASTGTYEEKRFESQVVCSEARTCDGILHGTRCDVENTTSTNIVLCGEESAEFAESNVIVQREEQTMEICEKVKMQEFERTNTGDYNYEVNNKYQLGELMSSCWQPITRQDTCSDSESDISGSSSDASVTDILPMLDELNPPVNLGTGPPSLTFRDSLNSSSDYEDDSDTEEDGELDSDKDGAEEKKDDGNNSEDSSDAEKDSDVDSLMEQRRTKNILKLELDKKLMDMQAADTIQKMEEASRFRVQVPSISTPRPKPFVLSNGSEETVELPQIPGSAPSVLLPWRKPFDISFDQIVDSERKFQETWTPRSYFPSTRHRKNGNLYVRKSTNLQQHNGINAEKSKLSGKDSRDSRSNSDSEEVGSNGKLFGSLEAHMGEEIKILSAAISDACVLEANYEVDEGSKNTNFSDDTYSFCIQEFASGTSEKADLVPAGNDQSALCSLSKENTSEQQVVEADSISEVNSLFKCRMDEVLVQSISESGIGQPLTVELEDAFNGTFSADSGSGMPVVEASSVEELNSRISQLTEETQLTDAASDHTSDNELVQNRSSETLPAENGHSSQLIEDGAMAVKFEGKPNELLLTDYGELPVVEMNSSFKKTEEEAQEQIYPSSVHTFGPDGGETSSSMLVLESDSTEDISSAFEQLSNGHDMFQDGEINLDLK